MEKKEKKILNRGGDYMKRVIMFLVIFVMALNLTGCRREAQAPSELTIYTYDSFISYGLPEATNSIFEQRYNCKVNYLSFGDSKEVLNRLLLEKDNPQADIFVGINIDDLDKALSSDLFVSYKPQNADKVPPEYVLDSEWRLVPFEGPNSIAILYDSEKIKDPPKSFNDLLKPEFEKTLILEDPRTSGPGMSLLLWTIAVYGEDGYINYWKQLNKTIFHIYPGWDAAFEAFTKGEAPMVISYDTDPAYFYHEEQITKYKAVIPEEGGWMYLEFAGIIKGTKKPELAQKYIDFMLSPEFQKEIFAHQWMNPIVPDTPLPEYAAYVAKASKYLTLPPEEISQKSEQWLQRWIEEVVSQ